MPAAVAAHAICIADNAHMPEPVAILAIAITTRRLTQGCPGGQR